MEENQIVETAMSQEVIDDGKKIALLSYLTIIGLIVAFVMNNEKKNAFASYHIRQMLGLTVVGLASGFISIIPILGWIAGLVIWVFLFINWISGLMNALNGRVKPMPILGTKFEEWFKGI